MDETSISEMAKEIKTLQEGLDLHTKLLEDVILRLTSAEQKIRELSK